MLKKRINWGILGTSQISDVMARAIKESDTGEVKAIASRSLTKAKNFSEKFSISKVYDDYQAMLNDNEIQAVYIGLPNHLHKEWIIRCANAGKHILCEKPFLININDAHEVISVIRKSHVFCMEALMYRYHPLTKKLQQFIHDKIIGKINLFVATYTANIAEIANPIAGGSIRNLGCYPVSLVRLLANSEPNEIIATGRINQKNNTDHQASTILKFADQSIAVVSSADDIEMFWQFDVYGTEGCLKVITNPWLPNCDHNKIIVHHNKESAPIEFNITAEKSLYVYQIDAMGENIMNKKAAEVNEVALLDSLGNIIVLETWLEQINKNSNAKRSKDEYCFATG
jgi:predicted dehydrogenase